jgi:GNAT superfamily N-acetyltransferase
MLTALLIANVRSASNHDCEIHRRVSGMNYSLRTATVSDAPALDGLIARSIRELGSKDYTADQIEAALKGAFGLDSTLIRDETYYVVLAGSDDIVGCGGWSRRRTLFGNDSNSDRDDAWLDPQTDRAKIRAFFIDPAHSRRGLGRMLLQQCESSAQRAGFRRFELMATIPGRRLYEACGYVAGPAIEHPLPGGQRITFVPMTKDPNTAV